MGSSWADHAIKALDNGDAVTIRPRGNSMTPRIKSGCQVTISPIDDKTTLKKGDIVLCKVGGRKFCHLISAIDGKGIRFQISNNSGHVNGWVGPGCIYGKVTKVEK